MSENIATTIKRHESTAEFWKTKADREWAYAVNGQGDYHYGNAKQAYAKADQFQAKADALRNSGRVTAPGRGEGITDKLTVTRRLGGNVGPAAKAGGVIGGGIALAESIANGDDFENTTKNVTSNAIKGAASSASGAMVAEGIMNILAAAPIPLPAKVLVATTATVLTGEAVSEGIEDFCDDVGSSVGRVASSIADSIDDAIFEVQCFWGRLFW